MTEKIEYPTRDTSRPMRKVDQFRWNKERQRLEKYQIYVPLELEDWEKEGLEKQAEWRRKKAKKKKVKPVIEDPVVPLDDEVHEVHEVNKL